MIVQIMPLYTPQLIICPFEDRHLTTRYVQWLNDKDVVKYSEQRHKHHTVDSCTSYWNQLKKSDALIWAIESRDLELGHIGNISVHFDYSNAVADVGILVGEKKVWGRGYGQEAFGAVCNFLLSNQIIRKVTSGTMASNYGMRGVMRRVGMKDDGFRKRQYLLDGKEEDAVYAALYRAE